MEDRSSRKRSLIFLIVVIVGFTVYSLYTAQSAPTFRFSAEQGTFRFSGAKNTSSLFSFDLLETLELYSGDAPDWGSPVDGGTGMGGTHYGTWESGTIGTYQAYVTERVHYYILARDGEKTAVFNTGNNELTQSLFQQLDAFRKGELQ